MMDLPAAGDGDDDIGNRGEFAESVIREDIILRRSIVACVDSRKRY